MRTAIIVAALCLLVGAQTAGTVALEFVGNVSHPNKASFAHRLTAAGQWARGAYFYSRSASADASLTSESATAGADYDSIWSMVQVTSGTPPISWLSYFTFDADMSATSDWGLIDISSAASMIASSYVSLIERAPNGTAVRIQKLDARSLLNPKGLTWTTSKVLENAGIHWITLTGALASESWNISLTFAVSDVVGVINYGEATVAPRMLECIVGINNWPYKSSENTVSLLVAAATGNANWGTHGVVSNQDNANNSEVFFTLVSHAEVDGEETDIKVSGFTDADWSSTFEDSLVKLQMAMVFGANFEVKQAEVTFPAGAQYIIYDPASGNGEDPYSSSSSSNKNLYIAIGVGVGCGVVVAGAVVAIAVVVIKKRRPSYVSM